MRASVVQTVVVLGVVLRFGAAHTVDDWHYPVEEAQETAAMHAVGLRVLHLAVENNSTGELSLQAGNGSTITVRTVGAMAFGWQLRGFLAAGAVAAPVPLAVLEYTANRWGRVEFVGAGGRVGASTSGSAAATGGPTGGLVLRKGVGRMDMVRRPRYNLTGQDPAYFAKVSVRWSCAQHCQPSRSAGQSAHSVEQGTRRQLVGTDMACPPPPLPRMQV